MTPSLSLEDVLGLNKESWLLRYFFTKIFAAENIDFLMAVRQLNPALGPAGYTYFHSAHVSVPNRASLLYATFIAENAPKQVNLSNACRAELDWMAAGNSFGQQSFNKAYKEILDLVDKMGTDQGIF
jgi:predicted negative regulator of RcsB-dependent stress response